MWAWQAKTSRTRRYGDIDDVDRWTNTWIIHFSTSQAEYRV